MPAFWRFAAKMLRYRFTLAAAMVMAFLSAASLGGGLLGIVPILQAILAGPDGQGAALPDLARRANERLPITIPDSWIAVLPTDRFDAVLWLILGLGALTIFGATANFLHAYFSLTVSTRTVAAIRRDVFQHVVHLPLRGLVNRTADTLSRILNDSNTLLGGFEAITSRTLAQLTKAIAALATALIIEWRLTFVALLVGPLVYIIIRKLGKRVRRASRGALQAQGKLLEAATEALQGLRVVKVYTRERREIGRFSRHNRQLVREQFRARTARALSTPLTEVLMIFVFGGLALFAAKALIDGAVDPAEFITALAALAVSGSALKPLTRVVQDVQTADAAAVRLLELMREPTEPVHLFDRSHRRRPRLARHCRSLIFDDVRFSYPGADVPAIDGVSLVIEHGETIAFVGPNGSGKTTLLSLVPRLLEPDSGRVLIDATDIAEVDLRSLRKQIGVVTQEVVLFHASITENIAYGAPAGGAAREQIIEAARRAGAHEFIMAKPDGYHAIVGEQGLTLSGGQRQRIAIARAILREPALLILDEATSMIDAESERLIGDAIGNFSRGRTCLIVAHRLSTVMHADRIVVMEAGRIVDVGEHADLLDRCETYRLLARTQLLPAPV